MGFRVQGSGFRVQGAGFRVQEVEGAGFRSMAHPPPYECPVNTSVGFIEDAAAQRGRARST